MLPEAIWLSPLLTLYFRFWNDVIFSGTIMVLVTSDSWASKLTTYLYLLSKRREKKLKVTHQGVALGRSLMSWLCCYETVIKKLRRRRAEGRKAIKSRLHWQRRCCECERPFKVTTKSTTKRKRERERERERVSDFRADSVRSRRSKISSTRDNTKEPLTDWTERQIGLGLPEVGPPSSSSALALG